MVDFHEPISGAVWLTNLEPLSEVNGALQSVKYLNSREFGRVLIINNEIQHVEAWAPLYHEIIVHLPLSFIHKPVNALIMGGGSLFAAEELLKYQAIEHVDLVDYDANVVSATIDAYPERKFVVSDPRLHLNHCDWKEFMQRSKSKYDLIVNDCVNLLSSDANDNFDLYDMINDHLTDVGICSDMLYRNIHDGDFNRRALKRLSGFGNRALSLLAVPEYPGIMHLLTMWGKNPALHQKQRRSLNVEHTSMYAKDSFKIFSPNFLTFYLYLPRYLSERIT